MNTDLNNTMTPTPPDKQESRDRELAEKILGELEYLQERGLGIPDNSKFFQVHITNHLSPERLAHEKEVGELKEQIKRLTIMANTH
jgi:hypothetical protein